MKELAEQAATGTYTTAQRLIMNSEYQAMAQEIDRIANATDFNGVKLLDGTFNQQHGGRGMKVHFGTGNDRAEDYYFIQMGDLRATTRSGLQIGGGENFWQTSALDATSPEAVLSSTGFFGIEISRDGLEEVPNWQMYGFVNINQGDTLQNIVDEINQGRQATGTLNFAAMDGTTVSGKSFELGNYLVSYTTAATSSLNGSTLSVGLNIATPATLGISATSVAEYTAAALNGVALTTVGVYGAVDGATLNLMAYEGGLDGNNIALDVSAATVSGTATEGIVASGLSLEGGTADTGIWAEAYENPVTGEWELRITGWGSDRIRVFAQGASFGDVGTVLDGSGTTTSNVWASGTITGVEGSGGTLLTAWASGDEDLEWEVEIADWEGQSIATQSGAQLSLSQLDEAINTKDIRRANLGAFANRLEKHHHQPAHPGGEPAGGRVAHLRRRHRHGDDRVHPLQHHGASRGGHAGPGQQPAIPWLSPCWEAKSPQYIPILTPEPPPDPRRGLSFAAPAQSLQTMSEKNSYLPLKNAPGRADQINERSVRATALTTG